MEHVKSEGSSVLQPCYSCVVWLQGSTRSSPPPQQGDTGGWKPPCPKFTVPLPFFALDKNIPSGFAEGNKRFSGKTIPFKTEIQQWNSGYNALHNILHPAPPQIIKTVSGNPKAAQLFHLQQLQGKQAKQILNIWKETKTTFKHSCKAQLVFAATLDLAEAVGVTAGLELISM